MSTVEPRTAKAARTRAAIADAAVSLVSEHGFDAVTVDMICARAGVSQRTFFNYFATKDAAVLGPELPKVDERAARAFIVSSGPLLAEAMGLVAIDPAMLPGDARGVAARLTGIAASPALMARQMERLAQLEDELTDIIRVRLRRDHPGVDDEVIATRALVITHLLSGVMRWIGIDVARRTAEGLPPRTPAEVQAVLDGAMTTLLGK